MNLHLAPLPKSDKEWEDPEKLFSGTRLERLKSRGSTFDTESERYKSMARIAAERYREKGKLRPRESLFFKCRIQIPDPLIYWKSLGTVIISDQLESIIYCNFGEYVVTDLLEVLKRENVRSSASVILYMGTQMTSLLSVLGVFDGYKPGNNSYINEIWNKVELMLNSPVFNQYSNQTLSTDLRDAVVSRSNEIKLDYYFKIYFRYGTFAQKRIDDIKNLYLEGASNEHFIIKKDLYSPGHFEMQLQDEDIFALLSLSLAGFAMYSTIINLQFMTASEIAEVLFEGIEKRSRKLSPPAEQ